MAKLKIKSINGYGTKGGIPNPWEFKPNDANTRGISTPAAGDYYGTAIKQPIGKSRSVMGLNPTSEKDLKKPPKSLA